MYNKKLKANNSVLNLSSILQVRTVVTATYTDFTITKLYLQGKYWQEKLNTSTQY